MTDRDGLVEQVLRSPLPPRPTRHPQEWPTSSTHRDDGTLEVVMPPEEIDDADDFAHQVGEDDIDKLFRIWKLSRDDWTIIPSSLRTNAWEAQTGGGGSVTLRQYKAMLAPKARMADLGSLLRTIRSTRIRHRGAPVTGSDSEVFVLAVSDAQIGKGPGPSGGRGTEDIVRLILDAGQEAVDRVKQLRRVSARLPTGVLLLGGDMVEGVMSTHESQTFSIDLDLAEQLEIFGHVVWELLRGLAPMFDEFHVCAVPGNHGEVRGRRGGGLATRINDSYDLLVPRMVFQALQQTGIDGFEHVNLWTPERDKGHFGLPLACPMAFVHGQQIPGFGGKHPAHAAMEWWKSHTFDRDSPIRDARILLVGHLHHFRQVSDGNRTVVVLPSPDTGSAWFTEQSGKAAPPGVVSFVADDRPWPVRDLYIHTRN